jgi:hypothetical protein
MTDRDEKVMTQAARDVLAERERQISAEFWTPFHDDAHSTGDLARAAAAYAISAATPGSVLALSDFMFGCRVLPTIQSHNCLWPWQMKWWKPKDPRRDLVRAGALILAEIERLDRAALKGT